MVATGELIRARRRYDAPRTSQDAATQHRTRHSDGGAGFSDVDWDWLALASVILDGVLTEDSTVVPYVHSADGNCPSLTVQFRLAALENGRALATTVAACRSCLTGRRPGTAWFDIAGSGNDVSSGLCDRNVARAARTTIAQGTESNDGGRRCSLAECTPIFGLCVATWFTDWPQVLSIGDRCQSCKLHMAIQKLEVGGHELIR